MRNIYRILFLSITLLMLGCSDIYDNETEDDKEQTVRILLSFGNRLPQSKSIDNILSGSEEDKINTLQVMIFRNSGEGKLVKNYFFEKWNGREIIDAYTGRFRYVMIANHPQINSVEKYSDISSLIYRISSEEELVSNKSLVAAFDKKLLVPYPSTPGGIVELKDNGENIRLTRLAAKIQFSLLIDDITLGNGLGKLRDRLRIKSIELKKISAFMYMFRPNAPIDETISEALSYPSRIIDIYADKSQPIYENYYIPERIAGTDSGEGTYAEIKAEYSDIDNNNPTKIITYKVKINTKPVENNQYTGLFNVVRNSEYQMNIRIQGVNSDDIRVEIEDIHEGYVFVDCKAKGRKTGGTWEDAFNTIGEALLFAGSYNANAININKIKFVYVKEGTYNERIMMLNNVSVIGGYSSTLKNKDLTQDCSIKPVLNGAGLSGPLVSFEQDLTVPTMFAFFEVKNGWNETGSGGAFYLNSENAFVQSCFIHNNKARYGGAAYLLSGQIRSSVLINNKALLNGAAVYAGKNGSIVKIINSTIVDNFIDNETADSNGRNILFSDGHPFCEVSNSIILNQNSSDCSPLDWKYKNCAFVKEDLLSWAEICNGNVRICSESSPHAYPYASKITSAGFKSGSAVFDLDQSSDLVGRGYLPQGDFITDFNGHDAIDPFFPDLGASQSGVKRNYFDLYIKNPVYFPFKNDMIDCVIYVNSKDIKFSSSDMQIASQSPDIFKNVAVRVTVPNETRTDQLRRGMLMSKNQISFDVNQAFMNFELNPQLNLPTKSNIVLGPDASNTLSELLWDNEVFFQVTSSVPESDRNIASQSFVNWIDVLSDDDRISFSKQSLKRKVTEPGRRYAALNNLKLYYLFNKDGEQVNGLLNPISKNIYLTQTPEWELCQNPLFNVLGADESDYSSMLGSTSFSTWILGVNVPNENSETDGRINTLNAVNALISGSNFNGIDKDELMNNAFLFCTSLNKNTKSKIYNTQTLTLDDIEWYLPSINQLKLMCIFESNALELDLTNYYMSSTFRNNSLIRFDTQLYQYWQAIPELYSRKAYVRCVRDTRKNITEDQLLASIVIQDTESSYIVNSSDYYSTSIVRAPEVTPTENELAEKFEIAPVQTVDKVSSTNAAVICSSLLPANTWRLPTQKEIALICLYQHKFSKPGFTPFVKNEYHFKSMSSFGIPVQDFATGAVKIYQGTVNGYVRCVKSVQ